MALFRLPLKLAGMSGTKTEHRKLKKIILIIAITSLQNKIAKYKTVIADILYKYYIYI